MTVLDMGDVYNASRGFEVFVYDDFGTLAAATVSVDVTLPDGTSTSPSVTSPSTGRYQASYKPVQAGTHYVVWTATSIGGVAGSDEVAEDTFTVSPPRETFVTLAEAKAHLNIPSGDTGDDDELAWYLHVACDLAQRVADTQFARTNVVDTLSPRSGEKLLLLSKRPVLSVTSVVEEGAALVADVDYGFDSRWGHLYRLSGAYSQSQWSEAFRSVVVTYIAGYEVVPARVRFATLVIFDHAWKTQRGGSPLGGRPMGDDAAAFGSNWVIPNRARDILEDYRAGGFG